VGTVIFTVVFSTGLVLPTKSSSLPSLSSGGTKKTNGLRRWRLRVLVLLPLARQVGLGLPGSLSALLSRMSRDCIYVTTARFTSGVRVHLP
jgi:hypothetical protein